MVRWWDRVVGPGAGTGEVAGAAVLAAGGLLLAPRAARVPPSGRATGVVLRLLAGDLWGGAWCTNTRSAARWAHRPGRGRRPHRLFAVAHVHPLVLAALDARAGGPRRRARRLVWALGSYAYLLAATEVVLRSSAGRRRATAVAATAGAVVLDRALGPPALAPWSGPVYAVKLLAGRAGAAALRPGGPVRPSPSSRTARA